MRAGRLRHKISIQRLTSARDEFGGVRDAWLTVHPDVRAGIEVLSGREFVQAQQINSEITTRIKIRHRDGITPDMRAVTASEAFDILAVVPDFKHREAFLLCKQVNEPTP